MNIEKRLEQYGWDGKFFLLTRDHIVEVTVLGGGFDGGKIDIKGSLFHYANQCLLNNNVAPNEEIDEFGRNYLDRMFISLCILVLSKLFPSIYSPWREESTGVVMIKIGQFTA